MRVDKICMNKISMYLETLSHPKIVGFFPQQFLIYCEPLNTVKKDLPSILFPVLPLPQNSEIVPQQ